MTENVKQNELASKPGETGAEKLHQLLTDDQWSAVESEYCKVLRFNPLMSSVVNGEVVHSDLTTPYAMILFRCKKIPEGTIGFITHKIDFLNMYRAFEEKKDDEEIDFLWTREHYKVKMLRHISRLYPKLIIRLHHEGALELLSDPNHRPELRGRARGEAAVYLKEWKPSIIDY